jgi:hypothetical protein
MKQRGERQKAGEADGSGRRPSTPKLSDLGVTKTQASRRPVIESAALKQRARPGGLWITRPGGLCITMVASAAI